MTRPNIRVIKVGGSLLDCEALPQLLVDWFAISDRERELDDVSAAPRFDVLIAGGGQLVDHIRALDHRFSIDPATAHWISVSALSCTAQLLAHLARLDAPVVHWNELRRLLASSHSRRVVFDVRQWLTDHEATQPGRSLHRDWRATSDSIAGRLTHVLSASELVLLKSTDRPPDISWQELAVQGLVDDDFPSVAEGLPQVTWINLRLPTPDKRSANGR